MPLVVTSKRIWRELEAETCLEVFVRCGAPVMGPGDGVTTRHGTKDVAGRSIDAATRGGVAPFSLERFP